MLLEYRNGTTKEFYDAMTGLYGKDFEMIDINKSYEKGLQQAYGCDIFTRVSDDGKVFFRWLENDETIFITGLLSLDRQMNRAQLPDAYKLLTELGEKLKSGKDLYTSWNEFSKPILSKLLDRIKGEGFDVSVQRLGVMTLPEGRWEAVHVQVMSSR